MITYIRDRTYYIMLVLQSKMLNYFGFKHSNSVIIYFTIDNSYLFGYSVYTLLPNLNCKHVRHR